jgi:hypothetical protein
MTKHILRMFGDASGLVTNMEKTEFFPIRCQDIPIETILGSDIKISSFPCMYLGHPLHYKKLPRSMVQPFVQRIGV